MPTASKPSSITIDAQHFYWGLTVIPSLDETGVLRLSGAVMLHRAQKNGDGTYTPDPSTGSSQSIPFGDMIQYLQANHPELLPQVMEAWSTLDSVVDALNTKLQLV